MLGTYEGSQYSDLLRAGRPGDRIPVGCDIFRHPSRLTLRPIQLPIQWVPGHFTGGKVARVWY